MFEPRTNRRQQHVTAAALLAVVALAVFWQLAQHPSDVLVGVQRGGRNDLTAYMLNVRDYPRIALERDGALPAWHDQGLLGSPWLANPQSALLYPPHWLCALLGAPLVLSWLVVAHHWFGGLGAYFLCRSYRGSFTAGLISGVSFLAAPYLLAQTGEGHQTQVCLVTWAPWAFLAYRAVQRGQWRAAPLLASILALTFFCGHVQECFYLALLLSCFAVTDIVRGRDGEWDWGLLRRWIVVGVGCAGLTAIQLAPNWIYTRHAIRAGGIDTAAAGKISAGLTSLWQLMDPIVLGGPSQYRGPGDYYWETLCFFGVVPLALAICCAVLRADRRGALRWLVVAAVTLLFALGDSTPVFGLLHRYVPGLGLFRSPGRALFFTSLAVSLLAGLGWQALAMRSRRLAADTRVRVGLCLAGGGVAVAALSLLLRNLPLEPRPSLVAAGTLVGMAAAIVAAVVARPRLRVAAGLAAATLCCVELSLFANSILATVPQPLLRKDSPITRYLTQHAPAGRTLARQELVTDREAWSLGIDKLRRYEPVPLTRKAALFTALAPQLDAQQEIPGFARLNHRAYRKSLLDMLGVTHMALAIPNPAPLDGWKLVAQGSLPEDVCLRGRTPRTLPFALYENQTPLPRAYLVGSARLLQRGSPAESQLAGLDPRREVLLEQDAFPGLPADERQPFRPAEIVSRTAHRVTLRAQLEAPGYLVLSDAYYPGWTATVNGKRRPVLSANLALRAVALPAGEHEVVFAYRTPGVAMGGTISVLAVLVLGFIAWQGPRWTRAAARRRPQPAAAPTEPAAPQPSGAA